MRFQTITASLLLLAAQPVFASVIGALLSRQVSSPFGDAASLQACDESVCQGMVAETEACPSLPEGLSCICNAIARGIPSDCLDCLASALGISLEVLQRGFVIITKTCNSPEAGTTTSSTTGSSSNPGSSGAETLLSGGTTVTVAAMVVAFGLLN